jgi:hypothetical protein
MQWWDDVQRFFSPEAGQQRRQWLNRQEDRAGDTLGYYLGPAAQPVSNMARIAGMLSPGADMMDAADQSRAMWNADTPLDAAVAGATMAGAVGMMALPGNMSAMQEGFGSIVDDMAAAYDPALMRAGLGPTAETPAQEVARMLAEGRAAEVTDDMMARVDPQEMFRLYEAGATGMDMPMDAASRMARAEGMGFGGDYYKSGQPDFDQFIAGADGSMGPASYVTPYPEVANHYQANRYQSGVVYPVSVRGEIADTTVVPSPEYRTISDAARRDGLSGASRDWDVAVFDPRNIRSQFARFDPRLGHLANLSAGIGGAAIGINALATPQQDDADRQLILDWLGQQ